MDPSDKGEAVPSHSHLLMRGIRKRYTVNGVLANDGVDFGVETGEIHALVGENGAGKTTLMRILDGLEQGVDVMIPIRSLAEHLQEQVHFGRSADYDCVTGQTSGKHGYSDDPRLAELLCVDNIPDYN